ncbi:hypothetical protein H632_c285p2 [Helicosporidium sp. ATCC 50920]|nr:hypothetical protein H632_c285p2 [Helicosporidium sp. ATCC 50920]|eukprot:KDD76284.1 hypothetical protein H632_c285p2 [Helicosporidium sp. ATCC 50920]
MPRLLLPLSVWFGIALGGLTKMPKEIVIDCRGHLLGRLASIVAKQLLSGHRIVALRCEEINMSGGMVRQKAKYERFLRKRSVSNPRHGAVKFRAPSKIFMRTVRGMVPHKTPRGACAMERLSCWEGIPPHLNTKKRVVVPDALRVMRLAPGRRYCSLGDISHSIGWKYQRVVKDLEDKRKAKSAKYYEAKVATMKLVAQARKEVAAN